MSNDKMREEFEAAIISEFQSVGCDGGPDLCRNDNNGDYLNQVIGGAWWAWQASRKSLVIELPKFDGYRDFVVRELQAAFSGAADRAGLKVRP